MRARDQIAAFIGRFPGRDDDEISAALQIKPRQTVNQACRALEKQGVIERRRASSGKLGNFPIDCQFRDAKTPIPPEVRKSADTGAPDTTKDWFWEGNVVDAVAQFLAADGWEIVSKADTMSKARGLDLHVRRGRRELLIEAKGYPSQQYRDPTRAGQIKPTNPTNQAQHWYSHALLKVLRLRSAHPTATPAIALPDMPRYRSLFGETAESLQVLKIAMLFVSENGDVKAFGL